MYIENDWGNYIGGSDDSLTLLEYLTEKHTENFSLKEIFDESGLNALNGDFRNTDEISFPIDGFDADIYYAIDIITNLAALLLECKVNGKVNIAEPDDDDFYITISPSEKELLLIEKSLADFSANPEKYDIAEMLESDELAEMAKICGKLKKELFS